MSKSCSIKNKIGANTIIILFVGIIIGMLIFGVFIILTKSNFNSKNLISLIVKDIFPLLVSLAAFILSFFSVQASLQNNKKIDISNDIASRANEHAYTANDIAHQAYLLSSMESKRIQIPYFHITSIKLIRSVKNNENCHYRYIAKTKNNFKNGLEQGIYYDDLEDNEYSKIIEKRSSIYFEYYKNKNCIFFNFIDSNIDLEKINNVILDHKVNTIKIVNFGVPIVKAYTNFAYIRYNVEYTKQKYLPGDPNKIFDINGKEEFEIILDEVTSNRYFSMCTLDERVYSYLDAETELLYSSIEDAGIKYSLLVLSLTLCDITHKNHNVLLILDTSKPYMEIHGFGKIRDNELENAKEKINENITKGAVVEKKYFVDLIESYDTNSIM